MSKKISQFPQITTRNNNDWLLIEEASTGIYKRIKVSDFIAGLSSGSSTDGGGTTPPSGIDPHFNNVVLLMHFNGADRGTTFTDVKGKTVTPFGDTKISTAQSKFGGASGYFDGSGDYLSIASNADFSLNADFTIEFFVNLSSLPANSDYQCFFEIGTYSGGMRLGIFNYQGAQRFGIDGSTIGEAYVVWNPSANTWYHVCVVRSGSTIKAYSNGQEIGSLTFAATPSTSPGIRIGGTAHASGQSFIGYIDELRVTKGVCRYTANFTPPTQAFPDN